MGGSVGSSLLGSVGRFFRPLFVGVARLLFPRSVKTKADASGAIIELNTLDEVGNLCEVTVRAPAGKAVTTFKATVTNETVILRRTADGQKRVDYAALAMGQEVRVWFPAVGYRTHLRHGAVRQILILGPEEADAP
jgi:hypothetical protein